MEDPFQTEERSSDPLGGHRGVEASAIQIQRVKRSDKIMYIPAAGKNTSDPPEKKHICMLLFVLCHNTILGSNRTLTTNVSKSPLKHSPGQGYKPGKLDDQIQC